MENNHITKHGFKIVERGESYYVAERGDGKKAIFDVQGSQIRR